MSNQNIGTFILALVGAAAWLPQVGSWVYSIFSKPTLRFVPEDTTEIGYTFYGPILNQAFAISTSRKDALIERISLSIIHEKGEQHDFHWKFLDEKGAEITSATGERAEFRKNQPAVALKISVLGLAEKKIGFQDLEYQGELISRVNDLQAQQDHLEKTKKETWKEETIKTKEFSDVLDFIKNKFYWKEGKYKVILWAYETSLKKPHVENFEFQLSKKHGETLQMNIKETQEHFKNIILYKGEGLDKRPQVFWRWVNPVFTRKKKIKEDNFIL